MVEGTRINQLQESLASANRRLEQWKQVYDAHLSILNDIMVQLT